MYLTHEQIAAAARGVLAVEPEGEYLHLHRCTPSQRQTYLDIKETHYSRACCTAGVRLEFDTDSTTLSMTYRYGRRASRAFLSIDVYADGVLCGTHVDRSFIDDAGGSCCFTLPAGHKRLTVYLPYTVALILHEVVLDDGAFFAPAPPAERRLLALGDSITHGYDASYTSQTYACNVARHFGWDLVNQGIAGYVHNAALLEHLPDRQPDVITTAYGTNDWSICRSAEEFAGRVEPYFARLHELWPDVPVLVILPIWRVDHAKPRPSGSFDEMRAHLAAIAEQYPGVRILDGMTAVPHQRDFYGDLRVHPNDMGFLHYTLAVIRELSTMI